MITSIGYRLKFKNRFRYSYIFMINLIKFLIIVRNTLKYLDWGNYKDITLIILL